VQEEYLVGNEYFAGALSSHPTSRDANLGLCMVTCGLSDLQAARRHIQLALESASAYRFPTLELLHLPAAAIMLALEGDREQAAELLAFALHHPAGPIELLEKWPLLSRLRAELETELGPEIFGAAWERGQVVALEEVLAALVDRFQV
jgi:hypothetical protein